MPNPATAGRWSGATPRIGNRSGIDAPRALDRGPESEWVKDAIDVLVAGALLSVSLFALLF